MNIKNYDSVILLAENEKVKLYLVRWGKLTRFAVSNFEDFNDLDFVGEQYENKTQFISKAYNYARKVWNFQDHEIKESLPRDLEIMITVNERVAINTAIQLLKFSNSDHADQCLCYLKSLQNKL